MIDSGDGETCDDGNSSNGDGCYSSCHVESGYHCFGTPSVCVSLNCGNGALDAGEGCDDGGNVNGDGCKAACIVETGYTCTGAPSVCSTTCGDGILVPATETCDD